MAEYCLNCWNKLNEKDDPPNKYIISKDLSLCEGCGEWKKVIVIERKHYYLHKFRFIILPFRIVYYILFILLRIISLPYWIYKRNKKDKPSER